MSIEQTYRLSMALIIGLTSIIISLIVMVNLTDTIDKQAAALKEVCIQQTK